MKILISWFDPRHDLEDDGRTLSKQGINYEAHQHWAKGYDQHLLLLWKESPKYSDCKRAAKALSSYFENHRIEAKDISFADPLSLAGIHKQVQHLLMELRGHSLDLLINPGYQMMQLSWMLCHQSLGLRTRLLQVRKREYTQSGRPEAEEVVIESSAEAYALLLQEYPLQEAGTEKALRTPTLNRIYERARIAAATDFPVLIMGESGTGKELLAKYIHDQSKRKGDYFPVNCAGLNDNLLQSQLFGHKKGAFTGADSDRAGFFEEADQGTLFLDEIGDISKLLQQTLLRVLQDKSYQRLSETKNRYSNARIIAATNKDWNSLSANDYFRSDLYYRLATICLELPSWRQLPFSERDELLNGLNERMATQIGRKPLNFREHARMHLLESPMPGNFRLLDIIFKRLYVFSHDKPEITLGLLREAMDKLFPSSTASATEIPRLDMTMKEIQQWHAKRVYQHQGEHLGNTSKALEISTNTLNSYLGR